MPTNSPWDKGRKRIFLIRPASDSCTLIKRDVF